MKAQINLLASDNISYSTPFAQASRWALTAGRWIIIFTELIVIAAFLTRFKLDRDIADINDQITQKAAVVDAYSQTEKDFRQVQNRLSLLNDAIGEQVDYTQVLDLIENTISNEITLNTIRINENQIILTGISETETSLKNMKNQLNASTILENVELIRVDLEQTKDNHIQFEINAELI